MTTPDIAHHRKCQALLAALDPQADQYAPQGEKSQLSLQRTLKMKTFQRNCVAFVLVAVKVGEAQSAPQAAFSSSTKTAEERWEREDVALAAQGALEER